MATLQIRKKGVKSWWHYPSDRQPYFLSRLTCVMFGEYLVIREIRDTTKKNGAEVTRYHYTDITVYDDTLGGSPETFPNQIALTNRLAQLEYVGFEQGGGGVGFQPNISNPQDGQTILYNEDTGAWENQYIDSQGDRFLTLGTVEVDGNEITLKPTFSWVIQQSEHSYDVDWVNVVPYTSEAGKNRTDIIVATNAGIFIRIQGVEGDVAVTPALPANTVLVTTIDVFENSIGTPTDPIIGSNYITKLSERLNKIKVFDGYIISISEDRRTFYINDSAEDSSILGCERASGYNDTLWSGSDLWIWNNSENDVILKNDSENEDVEFKFIFSETGDDFVLKSNSKAHFKYNGFNNTFEFFGSSLGSDLELGETSSTAYRGDRGKEAYDHSQETGNPHQTAASDIDYDNTASGLLAETVQELGDELSATKEDRVSVIPITANTTISALHHGKILLITADVTITFPTGLGAGFTGCAFRIATGGKMTPAFASGVTGNDFFLSYNPQESLYVFKESNSTNVFYAV